MNLSKTLVPIPSKRAIFRPNRNGTTYVYFTVKAYRNSKGKPTSQVIAIGKIDSETGKLIPNNHYYDFFPGKISLKKRKNSIQPISSQTYGAPRVFFELAKQCELLDILVKSFPKKWDKILAIATYMLCEGNVMSYIDDWFDETKIDFATRLNDVACSRLFESISEEEKRLFLSNWIKCRSEKEYILYDVTSISSYSQNIEILEWGYNRDNDKLPHINFGMFYGVSSRMPVYYHSYNGSIPDVSCLKFMMIDAGDMGIKNVCFTMDRGFVSEENINFMFENNYSFITSLPSNKNEYKALIDDVKANIDDHKNLLNGFGVYGIQIETVIYGQKLQAYVYYSLERNFYERQVLLSKIDRYQKELTTITNSKGVTHKFKDYFDFELHSKSSFSYAVNNDKINAMNKRTGYFILLSNKQKLNCLDVLNIYRGRDMIEKNFGQFKNDLDFRRIKTHYQKTMDGKVMVGFVALILRSYLFNIIKTSKDLEKMTYEKVLLELKKMKSITMSSKKEIPLPLNKIQKIILHNLKINLVDIEE
jgi:transposase